jgi:YVTN family beta-propeller protein
MLEIMILMSTILVSQNNIYAQTYETITKERELFKNNPQIPLGRGELISTGATYFAIPPGPVVNPSTNQIYIADAGSNTVWILDSDSGNLTNIHVGTLPSAIAITPNSNKIYVVNGLSNTVSVINGFNDREIGRPIPVGTSPSQIVVASNNPEKIYVTNSESNTVSVINASSDKVINTIPVGKDPYEMEVNSLDYEIYVTNILSHSISVINATSDKVINTIGVGAVPRDIVMSSDDEKIYVSSDSSTNNNVTVINASRPYNVISTIPVGALLGAMAISDSTNKIYVTNSYSNNVSVIDASSDKVIGTIRVGENPTAIAVSPRTITDGKVQDEIYTANSWSDTVSVINASTDKVISTIPVGYSPAALSANGVYPYMVYVLNSPESTDYQFTKTLSVIDGSVNKISAGVTFNIHPANSGSILCNNNKDNYPTNIYLYIASGTKCIAKSNKDFEFSGWIENLGRNSTVLLNQSYSPWDSLLSTLGIKPKDTSATFDVDRFGTFTANFKAVPPPVPPEYWIPLYGIIVSTIVGWSIPSIIGWIKSKRQISRANQYHKRIHSLYTDNNKLYENDKTLDALKTDIKNAYAEGKISEQSYNNLRDETSILYERAYKNKIDSLNGKVNGENNRIELDEIKNDITDAYAEGKITEQHYNNLKDETSILYERAYKSKIDSLNGKVDGENNRIELDEIKNDITDAYA